jgi:hypothetical protein
MSFKMLTGPYLNHLTRTASTSYMQPSAHTLFPSTNLFDNRSSKPAIFGSAQDDSDVFIDLNLFLGEFESSGQAATWSILGGSGTISTSSDSAYTGTYGAVLQATADEVIAYRDVTVRSGEELNFFGAARNTGAARIRNRQTGNWLSTAATWTSSQGNVLTVSSTSWATSSVKFSVESLDTCLSDTVTLRVYLQSSSAARFDALELWPSTNWFSVHGHNIPPFITPTIEYSTDGQSWTPFSTMTLRRDSFYDAATSGLTAYRFWRLLLDGTPDTDSLMYMGELVLGQYYDLLHNPSYGGTLRWQDRQTRLESDIGDQFISLHNQAPQRTLLLNFVFPSSTEYEQFHKQIFRGSRGGGNLICVAPEEMDGSVVILGRVRDQIDVAKNTTMERTSLLEIVEMPLPNAPEVAHAYDAPPEGGG